MGDDGVGILGKLDGRRYSAPVRACGFIIGLCMALDGGDSYLTLVYTNHERMAFCSRY